MPQSYVNITDEQLAALNPEDAALVRGWRDEDRKKQEAQTEIYRQATQKAIGLPETGKTPLGEPSYDPAMQFPKTEAEHGKMFQLPGKTPEWGLRSLKRGQQRLAGQQTQEEVYRRLPVAAASGVSAGLAYKSPWAGVAEFVGNMALPPRTTGEKVMALGAGPFGKGAGKLSKAVRKGGTFARGGIGAITGALETGGYATLEQIIDNLAKEKQGLDVPALALLLGAGAGTLGGVLEAAAARGASLAEMQRAFTEAGLPPPKDLKDLQSWKRIRKQIIPESAVPGQVAKREVQQLQLDETVLRRESTEFKQKIERSFSDLSQEQGKLQADQMLEGAKRDRDLALFGYRTEHLKKQQAQARAGEKIAKLDINAFTRDYDLRKVKYTTGERFTKLAGDEHLKGIAADSKNAAGQIATIRADLATKLADPTLGAAQKAQTKQNSLELISLWTQRKADADNLLIERWTESLAAEQKRMLTMPQVAKEQLARESDAKLFAETAEGFGGDIQELKLEYAKMKEYGLDIGLKHKKTLLDINERMAALKRYDSNYQADFAVMLAKNKEKMAGAKYRDNPRLTSTLAGGQADVLTNLGNSPAVVFKDYVDTLTTADQVVVQDAIFERMFADTFIQNKPWTDSRAKMEILLGAEKADSLSEILDAASKAFEKELSGSFIKRLFHYTPTLLIFHSRLIATPLVAGAATAFAVGISWTKLVRKALDNPKAGRALADWFQSGATLAGMQSSRHLKDLFNETAVAISPEQAGMQFRLAQNERLAAAQRQPVGPQPTAFQAPVQQAAVPQPGGQTVPVDRPPR